MTSLILGRWGGAAAVLGGLLWMAGGIATALKPEGCIGAECDVPGRVMRQGGVADAMLFSAAALLIALGVASLVNRARAAGRFGTAGVIGVAITGMGVIVLLIAQLVQAIFFGGDFPYMPLLLIPGALLLGFGLLVVGVTILRAAVLPRWIAWLLIVGTWAMLGFNDQNAQALMATPFGAAWVIVGCALLYAHRERGS